MASRSGSGKRSVSTRKGSTGDKDVIAELKDRVAVLENMLRSGQEHKAAGETMDALKDSEEMFRALANTSAAAILMHRGDDHIYANPAAEKITGYTKDELLSMPFWNLIHPLDRDIVKERSLVRLRGETQPHNYETRIQTRDGEIRWVLLSAARISFGGRSAVILTLIDISERKRAEETLKYAEEFNRSTLDSLPMNIAVLDESGMIVFANRAWMEYGRENDVRQTDCIGIGVNYLEVCRRSQGESEGNDARTALEGILAVMNGDLRTFEMEYPCHSPDKKRWYMMRVSRIRASTFQGAIVAHTDITRRKLSEDALAEEKGRAELYLDLMGHDINNLNQLARGYLELIDGMVNDEEIKQLLSKPMEAIDTSSLLIGNLRKLQLSRSGGHGTDIYDLGTLIEEVASRYKSRPDKYVSVTYDVARGVKVRANELLRDVFANLIDNAIKHSDGPAIVKIRMVLENTGGRRYCTVTVEDNGPGIPDDMKENIFNRLQRGNTMAKGSGIGLYLVKTLVESYGGKVWVEDKVKGDRSRGSRFRVMLPAAEE